MNKSQTIREWALSKVGCPYIFAAAGKECTPAYREQQMKSKPDYAANIKKYCPVLSGKQATCDGCPYKDKPSFDCSGLSMMAAKLVGISMPHGASSQWKGDYWDEKGTIDQMPLDMLCFVYNDMPDADPMGHVGIYLGDGYVVDARGHASGVMHTLLTSYSWDHYGILKGMKDEEGDETVSEPSYLTIHSKGFEVEKLQSLLNNAGFNCGTVDGIFGPKTEAAVKQLQASYHLPESGIVDEATQKALAEAQEVRRDTVRQGAKGPAVAEMQGLLVKHGITVDGAQIKADGIFGPITDAALKAFQVKMGLPANGVCDQATWAALLADPTPATPVNVYTFTVPGMTATQAMAECDRLKAAYGNCEMAVG